MLSAFTQGLLKVDPGLFLWTLISFGILLLILWKLAWKPIVTLLDARVARIRKDIETAEVSRKEAEELFFKHKGMIDYARDEALKIVTEGRSDAERVKSDIIDKANAEAEAIIQRAHREIDLAKEKAIEEMRSEIVNISTQIASKVIERNLSPEDQKRIVDDELSRLV
jgi:F-type H+-transporting ATPase subunit b